MTNPLYSSNALSSASDANYSALSDAYDGTPTKVTPLLATIAQGARPKKQEPAQYFNWFTNQVAQILSAIIGDLSQTKSQVFTAGGNWTAPANIVGAPIVIGYGGGGGGGEGMADGFSVTDSWCGGGGGGGGSVQQVQVATGVVGGNVYSVGIGHGGAGGTTSGANGDDGAATTLTGGSVNLSFAGGQGGIGGQRSTVSSDYHYAPGGASVAGTVGYFVLNSASNHDFVDREPSFGGAGVTGNATYTRTGCPSPQGFAGGAAASNGTDSGSYRGGGAGGGGGAGPGAAGTPGTSGGNGAALFGLPASSAGNAAANTGAGGGGSGGQGSGSTSIAVNGSGGNGGSGKLIVIWTEYGTR